MSRWIEVGDGVLARRHDTLDLTTGLVLGDDACLVVDTAGDVGQGAALARAIREVTTTPCVVAYTHAHFDHCFGTAALTGAPGAGPEVWAHERCRADLVATAETQRAHWAAHYERSGAAAVAAALRGSRLVLPTRTLTGTATLDLGGRVVTLAHLGRGHTDHDVVAHVPDAGVVFAGDLVEHGAPPAFEDAFPLAWPAAVRRLLDLGARVVVPGHGEPCDRAFVERQHAELVAVAALCRGEDVASPYPPAVTATAQARARA